MNVTNTIWLDATRLILLAAVIGYAAWKDHQTGEVSNKVWIYAPFGLCLTFLNCILNPELLLVTLLSFGSATVISFTIFYLGGWGGADAKAFLTIAASLPVTPFIPFNLVFMYPLNVILISVILAFAVAKIRHVKTVRFLPYVMVALFVAIAV